jgi:hypothetical protein
MTDTITDLSVRFPSDDEAAARRTPHEQIQAAGDDPVSLSPLDVAISRSSPGTNGRGSAPARRTA